MSRNFEQDMPQMTIRRKIAEFYTPSEKDKQFALGTVHPRFIVDYLAYTHRNADVIRNDAVDLKEDFYPKQFSVPGLTSIVINLTTIDSILNLARRKLQEENLFAFTFYQDYAMGMADAMNSIEVIENSLLGQLDDQVESAIDFCQRSGTIQPTAVDIAGSYIHLASVVRTGIKLLSEDPTGTLLVFETVKSIRDRESRFGASFNFSLGNDRDYVGAGAKLAEILYRATYPIVESTTTK